MNKFFCFDCFREFESQSIFDCHQKSGSGCFSSGYTFSLSSFSGSRESAKTEFIPNQEADRKQILSAQKTQKSEFRDALLKEALQIIHQKNLDILRLELENSQLRKISRELLKSGSDTECSSKVSPPQMENRKSEKSKNEV